MATLEKIRSKGVLLIVVVGVALLSFIIGDFLTQGSTFFQQSRETVAVVNGEKINIADYQELIDQITVFQKYETGMQDIDEVTMQQMRAFVWDQYVREQLLNVEAEKMGLTVTKDELSDRLIGNNIHPMIQQRRFFAGENGQFSKQMLLQFLNFKDEPAEDPSMETALQEYRKLWKFLERTVKYSLLQEKYNALLTKSVGANSLEAKAAFEASLPVVDVNYVMQPYFSIPDSTVKVSDKEIKDRYNKQLKRYRQQPNVSLRFVTFDIQPLEEDFTAASDFINKLKDEFTATNDVVELVNQNSDIPYTGRNYTATTVPAHLKEFAFSASVGAVYGPVFQNNAYTMARVIQNGISLPDSVKLRHIFLTPDKEAKADSIIGALKGGSDFGALAMQFSAVKETAANGGEIGWITEDVQGLEKAIINDAFAKGIREIFTFKSPQGTQIIQITEKTAPRQKVKLAILERGVIASSKTESKIFNDAKRFAASLNELPFDSAAARSNLLVRSADEVYKTNEQVMNIPQSRQIVRWAFENTKGEHSDVFECGKQLVVATISEVNKSDYRPLNKVAEVLKSEILRDKKAELLITQMAGKAGNDTSLVALAQAFNQEVKKASAINFASGQLGVAGWEPAVIGKATAMKANEISTPVKGNAGVYVVAVTNAQKTERAFDVTAEKMNIASRYMYSLPNSIMMNMMDKAKIEDNRLNFY
ncbi:MAG: SurA N-terminal domain-containing protein [Paludibacter sp.]|jgi:peptidyl-prolyl cis-trans isomerase D|nr:SurA N-terminal domain-containing protein [Paludibacter sp.]